jgi:progressive ankylosis protein
MRQRDLFLFWSPLFASWLLMTAEGPIVSAAINRLPDEVVMLAAQGIVVSLSVTIESPIINLLATSTALGRDRQAYLLLRRFTLHWMILLTAVAAAIAFTPLYDLVIRGLLAVPEEIALWIRPGLQIMTFWSAAIGWRRFLQGLLIRFNQTRKVAWGTGVRLISSAGTVALLASLSDWPGVVIGSTALMAGVVSEALYATLAVRPLLKNELGPQAAPATGERLTYGRLVTFHLPLAGTSLLVLLLQPMVAFSLARLPQPTLSLAAWPVVFQIMLIARAPSLALPEVVIALTSGEGTFRPLRRFSYTLFLGNTAAMLLFTFTPLATVYLLQIQDLTPGVAQLASAGLALFIPLPALSILISWIRGLLIYEKATGAVNLGMVFNLLATGLVLAMGVAQSWPGINTAAVAMSAAAIVELIFLWWKATRQLGTAFSLVDLAPRPATGQVAGK